MLTLSDVAARISAEGFEVNEEELSAFVEERWIIAREEEGRLLFDEADAARARLILELKRDMAVNDEAVPVILGLLDQLYGLRRIVEELKEVLQHLPPELREEIKSRIAAFEEGERG